MVEMIIGGNASPLVKTEDGVSAYSLAIDSGRKVVALLIAEAAVLYSITYGNMEGQLEYLKHGAYVNIRNSAGYTPLMSAVSIGDLTSVKELLNLGADPNRTENDGWSSLHFAAVNGFQDIAELLMQYKADPAIRTVNGKSARNLAEEQGYPNIVSILPDLLEFDQEDF